MNETRRLGDVEHGEASTRSADVACEHMDHGGQL